MTTTTVRRNPFPGFASAKQLVSVLKLPHNAALKACTSALFTQISEANQNGREEKNVSRKRVFLDAVAQILTGNEVCAAIAISGKDILISTNKGTHDQRAVSYSLTGQVIEKQSNGGAIRLGFTCKLEAKDGTKCEKRVGPVEFQWNSQMSQAVVVDPLQLTFTITRGEFAYLPDDEVNVSVLLHKDLDAEYFQFLRGQQLNQEFAMQQPVVACTGALKRRASKLFTHCSLIAKAITRRNSYLPEKQKPQHQEYARYIEKKIHEFRQSGLEQTEEKFILFIYEDCKIQLQLDQGADTREQFIECAKEHYRIVNLYNRFLQMLNQNIRWVEILNDTLTYELARIDFANDITVDSKNPKGVNELSALYKKMVEGYGEYRAKYKMPSSPAAVNAWFATIDQNSFAYPNFLLAKFPTFHAMARKHFLQLAVVEQYMIEDANAEGKFSERIQDETIFKEPKVIIVDGRDGVHAEMRLFSYHLIKKNDPTSYYGITRLCCAMCNYVLKRFRTAGFRPPETRGTHTTIHKWPLADAFMQDEFMHHFLGNHLNTQFQQLSSKQRIFSLKKGEFYDVKDVFCHTIEMLDGINTEDKLQALGIDKALLLPGSTDQHPNNMVIPSFPPEHSLFPVEQKLQNLKEDSGSLIEIFDCLLELGIGWRKEGRFDAALYYLEQAAGLVDEHASNIAEKKLAQLYHTLGIVYAKLDRLTEAKQCYEKALLIKRKIYSEENLEIAKTKHNLGIIYYRNEQFSLAYDLFTQALTAAKNSKDEMLVKRTTGALEELSKKWEK